MWMSLCFVQMDRPPNPAEEAVESVNPKEQGLPAFDSSESIRRESHATAEQNEKKNIRNVICKRHEKKRPDIEHANDRV